MLLLFGDMTLTQIEIFKLLSEERNFSVVAEKLGITQPAVSNAIKKFETELQTPLISRLNKDFVLTEEGARIIAYCEEIVAQVQNIRNESRVNKSVEKVHLKMGTVWSANNRILPKLINYYKRKNPLVRLTVLEGSDREVECWINDGFVDFGIFSWLNEDLKQEIIAEDKYFLVVSKKNKLGTMKSIDLKMVLTQPIIISDAGCGPLIIDLFKNHDLNVEINYHVRELMTILAMTNENMAVSIIPELAIPEGYPDLKFIPISHHSNYNRKLYFSYKKSAEKVREIKNFKLLCDNLNGMA